MTLGAQGVLAAWLLTGAGLGFLSTAYGAVRSQWRLWKVFGHFLDWLWFVLAAIIVLAVYIWSDWGAFHFWSFLVMAGGYALWASLAAPFMLRVLSRMVFWQARIVFYLLTPLRLLKGTAWAIGHKAVVCCPRNKPPLNPPES